MNPYSKVTLKIEDETILAIETELGLMWIHQHIIAEGDTDRVRTVLDIHIPVGKERVLLSNSDILRVKD